MSSSSTFSVTSHWSGSIRGLVSIEWQISSWFVSHAASVLPELIVQNWLWQPYWVSDSIDTIGPDTTAVSLSQSITRHVTVFGLTIAARFVTAETLATILETNVPKASSSTKEVTVSWIDSSNSDVMIQVSSGPVSVTTNMFQVLIRTDSMLWLSQWLINSEDKISPNTTAVEFLVSSALHVTILGSFVSAEFVTTETLSRELDSEVLVALLSTSVVTSSWSSVFHVDVPWKVSSSPVSVAAH